MKIITEAERKLLLTIHETEQILGRALHYPRFCDDQKNFPGATDANGVCVGDHVVQSIAEEAANRIAELEAENERLTTENAELHQVFRDVVMLLQRGMRYGTESVSAGKIFDYLNRKGLTVSILRTKHDQKPKLQGNGRR